MCSIGNGVKPPIVDPPRKEHCITDLLKKILSSYVYSLNLRKRGQPLYKACEFMLLSPTCPLSMGFIVSSTGNNCPRLCYLYSDVYNYNNMWSVV